MKLHRNDESLGVSVFLEEKEKKKIRKVLNINMPHVLNDIFKMVKRKLSGKYDMFAINKNKNKISRHFTSRDK